MKRTVMAGLVLLMLICLCACQSAETGNTDSAAETEIIVAVGIVPEATFVEKVAGDLAQVVTLVPSGYSPANYQPTAAEMQALSDAAVYFTLQMPTEEANILPEVADYNADIMIVNLRDTVSAVYPLLTMESHIHDEAAGTGTEGGESVDPHLWLSPKRAVVMVQTIADELSDIDPDNAETYQQNAADYIAEIEELDEDIREAIAALDNKSFLIYHAAYGYFADDYGLTMVSIEIEGKQATASEMQDVIHYALENGLPQCSIRRSLTITRRRRLPRESAAVWQRLRRFRPTISRA